MIIWLLTEYYIRCFYYNSFLLAAFEYTACDPGNLCDSAKVDVIVGPVIDAVFARDDRVTVVGSEPVEVNVTKNDAVRVNYPLTVTKTRGSRNGTCVITSDTQITYTANEGFQGRDRCEYTVCATEICDEARLEIQVLAPVVEMSSSGPIANADAVTIEVNEVAHIDPLRNDDDADGDVLTVTSVSVPDNGDVVIVNGGLSLEYMPDEGFTGVDSEFVCLKYFNFFGCSLLSNPCNLILFLNFHFYSIHIHCM